MENPNITFYELKSSGYKEQYVVATCLNKQKMVTLSEDTYPDMKVKDAIRISMSIPLYFQAVFVDETGKIYKKNNPEKKLDIMVDWGITGNFPMHIFDSVYVDEFGVENRIPNMSTLGIRIDSNDQIKQDQQDKSLIPMEITDIKTYMEAFYTMVIENLNRNQLNEKDWERTISVSSIGIGPKIKKLSDEQKLMLMNSGQKAVMNFFEFK